MSITKWWFNLDWSRILWRRVKLPQKEASAYYLREEFLPQAVRPSCRQSWTSFIACVIQLFFKRKRQSTRDPQCKHRKQSDLLEENPSDDNNRPWRGLWTIFLHLLNQLLYKNWIITIESPSFSKDNVIIFSPLSL